MSLKCTKKVSNNLNAYNDAENVNGYINKTIELPSSYRRAFRTLNL